MFSRAIVFRWQRTMRIGDERGEVRRLGSVPCSMSCSVAARIFSRSLSPSYHSVTRA